MVTRWTRKATIQRDNGLSEHISSRHTSLTTIIQKELPKPLLKLIVHFATSHRLPIDEAKERGAVVSVRGMMGSIAHLCHRDKTAISVTSNYKADILPSARRELRRIHGASTITDGDDS